MRIVMATAVLAVLVGVAQAQQPRPQGQRPTPPQQAQPAAPALPPIFPCRTAEEVCFLGIVTGSNQIIVLFTNAKQIDDLEERPISVLSGDAPGAAGSAVPLDLAAHIGRVVMLTGSYDRQAGLTKAELVEVASPLVSLSIKAQVAADEPPPPPPRGGRPQGPPRR